MKLRHIVVAVDESDAGRSALRAGLDLAARVSARMTVMRTAHGSATTETPNPRRLRQWVAAELPPPDQQPPLELAMTCGLPGVEIPRFAEDHEADLLVLGRKQRTARTRLLLGDTADAVARRSRVPCLFVQPRGGPTRRILAALDGTERGRVVLQAAMGFAADIGAELRTVTVARSYPGEPAELADAFPTERSARLQREVQELLGDHPSSAAVRIRRGVVVDEVLTDVKETESDTLAIGYHRGGPPGILDAGSTARCLAHLAPCAVLTIPL